MTLEPGGISETVQVVAEAPQLTLTNGSNAGRSNLETVFRPSETSPF
jgi:hypothetical protein